MSETAMSCNGRILLCQSSYVGIIFSQAHVTTPCMPNQRITVDWDYGRQGMWNTSLGWKEATCK